MLEFICCFLISWNPQPGYQSHRLNNVLLQQIGHKEGRRSNHSAEDPAGGNDI
ncbi:hypothetical protein P7K49_018236 [Saguinus oedipus]|uniref:Uncharacterized protein n=1 Tax=Saguinus oedipus TaxID=9490 RepID=A0ABQ9V5G7_SAGOE|nr:hypothetical protein P7K49_018236 [Saguinus oedipus]